MELILPENCSNIFAIKLTIFSAKDVKICTEHDLTFSLEKPIYLPRFASSVYPYKFWVTSIHNFNSLNTLLNIFVPPASLGNINREIRFKFRENCLLSWVISLTCAKFWNLREQLYSTALFGLKWINPLRMLWWTDFRYVHRSYI